MEEFNFSDDEIRQELSRLGYADISSQRLLQFKMDLERLVSTERSKDTSQNTTLTHQSDSTNADYHYTAVKDRYMADYSNNSATHYPQNIQIHDRDIYTADSDQQNVLDNDLLRCGRIDLPTLGDDSIMDQSITSVTHPSTLDDTNSELGSYRRYIRRKTSRKAADGSRTIDESVTESEPGDLDHLDERLRELGLRTSASNCLHFPRSQSAIDPPYRLDPEDPRPPSVIYSSTQHPHTRNLRKSDPVARYQQMKDNWRQCHLPGEVDHRQLRWQVRELMVQRDPLPKKTQRTFVANNYVVPSNKKRSALRWQIRTDMAHGNMPHNSYCDE